MQAFFFFFFRVCSPKGNNGDNIGDSGNWDKNSALNDNIFRAPFMFCAKILGKVYGKDVELFRNGSVNEFYRLKALITKEQVNA